MSDESSPPPIPTSSLVFQEVLQQVTSKEAKALRNHPKYQLVSLAAESLVNKVSGTLLGGLNLKQQLHYRLLREGSHPVSVGTRAVRLNGEGSGSDAALEVRPVLQIQGCVEGWEEHCVGQLTAGGSPEESFDVLVSQSVALRVVSLQNFDRIQSQIFSSIEGNGLNSFSSVFDQN